MRASKIVIYAVVLWTLVEVRNGARLPRSLVVESEGRNLTEKLQQEIIHSDVLQHFSLPQTSPETTHEVPPIPEDSNVQSLKNDDHIRESSAEDGQNKTVRSNTNDFIIYKYNQTGSSSLKKSEVSVSHSSYEQSSIVYDEEESDQEEKLEEHTPEYRSSASSAEPLKEDVDWKSIEIKKKEKAKKEILDTVTVPTDHIVAGKLEKPLKDNIISVKIKEKNKESISEALDEKRSTSRISNSSSISLREHDSNNNKRLTSLDIFKVNEEPIQSVNSVINGNGVNGESLKKPRVKYSVKRVHDVANDTEADNSSASDNLLNEDAASNTVPLFKVVQTTPSIVTESTSTVKASTLEKVPLFQRPKPTESSPTKIDIFGKSPPPSPTSIVKPSIAFKQQLANKLKGFDPAPTTALHGNIDAGEDNSEKSGKSTPKTSLWKKPKPEYYSSTSESYIPPTATAWTLVSMKAAADDLKSRKPAASIDKSLFPVSTTTPRQTTITPVTRVRSFVPWSTRLLKNTSMKPPTTSSMEDLKAVEKDSSSNAGLDVSTSSTNAAQTHSPEKIAPSSTTEEQSVIRTTLELDRNSTDTSINLIHTSLNDVMIKDQSSTVPRVRQSTTEKILASNSTSTKEQNISEEQMVFSDVGKEVLAKENTVEAKQVPEESNNPEESEEKLEEEVKEKSNINSKNIAVNNEVSVSDGNENPNKVKPSFVNESFNNVLTTSTTASPEISDSAKTKNNDFGELDVGLSDIFGDGEEMKSGEDFDEYERPKKTTTLPPLFDFETTVMSDLDDDLDGDEEEELSIILDRITKNQSTTTPTATLTTSTSSTTLIANSTSSTVSPSTSSVSQTSSTISSTTSTVSPAISTISSTTSTVSPAISTISSTTSTENILERNLTKVELKPTVPTPVLDVNSTGTYVTSFDIVSKENTTQAATKTPSEGDINWYDVETKSVSVSDEETSNKTVSLDTTANVPLETTNEPETTTESNEQETTLTPEIFEPVTTLQPSVSPSTTTTSPVTVTEPSLPTDEGEGERERDYVGEDPRACVRVVVHISPWKLCHDQQELRENIASKFMTEEVSWEQILLVSDKLQDCEAKEQSTENQLLDVEVCFIDKLREPSPALRDEFMKVNTKRSSDPNFPIVEVLQIMTPPPMTSGFDNVLAAIILSVIAAICLLLLGILLVIVRKRQSRFNYGQRCTPVSLDDYSLDNISVYNSVRRKGMRASKRSYGNPGFDDPSGPTHSVNFAGLANVCGDRAALDEEYGQIPMITVKPDELPAGAESKNRYANVIPLPETRVPLQAKEGSDPLDEYINANYIKGPKGQEKLYIACQAPLQSTVEDFWRMVWQQQTKVILMLTALNENGVDKCADYLPQLEITDCHRLFGDFQVTLKKHEVREKYIISSLQLKNLETNLWREVTHLWYVSWPAQGVPDDGSALIAFLIEARSYARGATGPTVVHCSPGTGRTGTVIAIDLCIRDFETQRTVDIPRTVYALRRERAGAVQTKDQYAFIYQVLNLYATKLTGGALDSI